MVVVNILNFLKLGDVEDTAGQLVTSLAVVPTFNVCKFSFV